MNLSSPVGHTQGEERSILESIGLDVTFDLRNFSKVGMLSDEVGIVVEDGCFKSLCMLQYLKEIEVGKWNILSS